MDTTLLNKQEVDLAINELVSRYRLQCLWFAPRDYYPSTDSQRITALANIERYGDREALIRSREFRDWLLQHSKELSPG